MKRFARTELLLGREAMNKLAGASVAVVGLGAVGSYAVEGLARSGIGRLRLVDFDDIKPSNINRQLYAADSTLGQPKAEVAARRVRDINPDCAVEPFRLFVDRDTAPAILRPPLDIVIDAIDSVGPKVELIAAAVRAGVPVISSMGAATRRDPQAIRVSDLADTGFCPLARRVRKALRYHGIVSGVTCVYSVEPSTTRPAREPDSGEVSLQRGRARHPLGSLSCLTGIFGLTAAHTAILRLVR